MQNFIIKKIRITGRLFLTTCFLTCFIFSAFTQVLPAKRNIAYKITLPQRLINGKYQGSRVYEIEQLPQEFYMKNTFHIKFKNKLTNNQVSFAPSTIRNYFQQIGLTGMRCIGGETEKQSIAANDYYGIGRIYEVSYSADIDPYDICKKLINDPEVEYAVPVFIRYISSFTPNDPRYSSQYALSVIQASKAWDISKGDTNVVIAILDVGTYWQHEDLLSNIWTNRLEIAGNGKDDDSSGKIDDIHGWDFVGNISVAGSWQEDNNPTNTAQTHGTHTAGLASAVTNNGKGVASIGYRCRLMPVKLGSDNSSLNGVYRGYEGILYAAKMGADIINCSWGGPGSSPAEEDMINQATAMGSLIVASSGNYSNNSDYAPGFPGAYSNVFCVGSTNASDQVLTSSNYGYSVEVYAPGENILSTYPNNQYQTATGTSMASPITAGLAGLVKSLHKSWTPRQIKSQIRGTCDKIVDDRLNYFGRINAWKALMFNSDSFPAKTIPGIYTTKVEIKGDTAIKTYSNQQLTIYITNCLSKADTLHISLSSLDNYVSLSKNNFDIYNFKNGDTIPLVLNVQLQNNFPWSKGNLELLLNYTSRDYYDLEKNNIPVSLAGGEKFTIEGSFTSQIGPRWNGVSAPEQNLAWGIGTSQVYGLAMYFCYSGALKSNFLYYNSGMVTDPVYCIGASNNSKAVAGTGKGYVYRTNNGGSSWSRISTTNFADFINSIHFYDANEAVVLGDPKNNLWGVALSHNGALSFTAVDSIPLPITGETGLVGSSCFNGKKIWFGTSKGRLFNSPDSGKTWTVDTVHLGGVITQVAFSDKKNGIVAYRETSNSTDPLYLASTSDGGKTWLKKIENLTSMNQVPLNFSGLPLSKMIVGRYDKGDIYTTNNSGTDWSAVMSEKSVEYQAGDIWSENGLVQLWGASNLLTLVEFNYKTDSSLGISQNTRPSQLRFYPNPVSGELNISNPDMQNALDEILIFDQAGKQLDKIKITDNFRAGSEITYRTAQLVKGCYILLIRNKNGSISYAKFIKI